MGELMRVRRQESLKACKYVRSRIERQSPSGAWQGPVEGGKARADGGLGRGQSASEPLCLPRHNSIPNIVNWAGMCHPETLGGN